MSARVDENKPLISIIVPVYNTKKYLKTCVDSILNQTYENIELILVNDGSTDDSGEYCDELAKNDARIKVLHKENGGQATARNLALSIASGDYIGFIDSDDYILPQMYQTLYDSLIKNDADISVCARYDVYEDGRKEKAFDIDTEVVMTSEEALKRLLIYDKIDSAPWDKLYKKELFNGITFPAGYICEDIGVIYRLLHKANTIVHCGKCFYCYCHRVGTTSTSPFSQKSKGLEIYPRDVYEFIQNEYSNLTTEAVYFYVFSLLILYDLMVYKPTDKTYMKEIQRKIRSFIFPIMKNEYLSRRAKLHAILISANIYYVTKKSGRCMKCVIKKVLR